MIESVGLGQNMLEADQFSIIENALSWFIWVLN